MKQLNHFYKKITKKALTGLIVGFLIVAGIILASAITEPNSGPSGFDGPVTGTSTGNWTSYGRGWVPNASGDGSTVLSKGTCDSAYGWYWFEDGNGDGDMIDEEDGICVKGTSTTYQDTPGIDSWNGNASTTLRDNTYIPAYTCAGNFPNGYVATYSGLDANGNSDTTYNEGDCALCESDCFDGKKDLPDQNGYTMPKPDAYTGVYGPVTANIIENWTGTKLPTQEDYFGFCGYKNGSEDYATDCSSDTSHGDWGQMVGRTDECLDISNYGGIISDEWEWLASPSHYVWAKAAGWNACSFLYHEALYETCRFRAVFRP